MTLILLTLSLCSCQKQTKQLVQMSTLDKNDYVAIVWGDKTYVPFCAIDNSERGAQLGIVDEDDNNQIYEYKGYSTEEWVISFYHSGEMDSSMLMREIKVTEIPEGLQSEYEWNKD
jgi:hypothetical protein